MFQVEFTALPARFREKIYIDRELMCWLWLAGRDKDGYGKFKWEGQTGRAHRFSWSFFHGQIPGDFQIDHLCKRPGCVNPEHLELVSWYENVRRGNCWTRLQGRTHCSQGHSLADCYIEITAKGRPYRRCRVCKCAQSRKDGKRYRQKD